MNQRVYLESKEFLPTKGLFLVKPVEFNKMETTESGIVFSVNSHKSVHERPTSGEVVALGDDVENVKIGDVVLWPMTDGINIEFNDGEFLLLKEDSLIGFKKEV